MLIFNSDKYIYQPNNITSSTENVKQATPPSNIISSNQSTKQARPSLGRKNKKDLISKENKNFLKTLGLKLKR